MDEKLSIADDSNYCMSPLAAVYVTGCQITKEGKKEWTNKTAMDILKNSSIFLLHSDYCTHK